MSDFDGFGHVSAIVVLALGIAGLALWTLPLDAYTYARAHAYGHAHA